MERETTRERSPNYPGIGLPSAVDLVKKLFKEHRRSTVLMEEVATAWGHDSLSGPARVRLAALRQYGLIDTQAGNKVRVSDLGLTVCVPPSQSAYEEALREAALSPQLFLELWSTMRDASDGTIRHHLMRNRRFSLDGATRVIKSYRATIKLVNLPDESYDNETEVDVGQDAAMQLTERHEQAPPMPQPAEPLGARFRYGLSTGVVAELTFTGSAFTARDLQLLRKYLELQEEGLKDETGDLADVPASAALPEPSPIESEQPS
jgi:hypothetical protein